MTPWLLWSHSASRKKASFQRNVWVDRVIPVTDGGGREEEYSRPGISHDSGEFKEEREREKGHALSLKFSAQDMVKRVRHVCHDLLQLQHWRIKPELRHRVSSYNFLNHSINWMQSLIVSLPSKLEHLLRESRILTEALLVDSDDPDYSVSLKTSEYLLARSNSSFSPLMTQTGVVWGPHDTFPFQRMTRLSPQLYCTL